MKTQVLFLILFLLSNFLKGQKDTLGQSHYKCSFHLVKHTNDLKGEIYLLNDSAIIVKQIVKNNLANDKDTFISIAVCDIEKISIKKKGAPLNGFLLGGVVGAVVGGLAGFSGGDDESGWFSMTAEEKAQIGSILGFIPGALIGLGVGRSKEIVPIQGSLKIYNKHKKNLIKFSIVH